MGRRLRRWVLMPLVAVAVLGAAWLVVCIDRIATPRVDEPGPVDAIYVLGPAESRWGESLVLLDAGHAPTVLATVTQGPHDWEFSTAQVCGWESEGWAVRCVHPEPHTTRGEARLLAQQVADEDWDEVAIVTSRSHAARTRMLMERCVDAEIRLWITDEPRDLGQWLYEFAYESAAWVKAQLVRSC